MVRPLRGDCPATHIIGVTDQRPLFSFSLHMNGRERDEPTSTITLLLFNEGMNNFGKIKNHFGEIPYFEELKSLSAKSKDATMAADADRVN